MEKNYPNWIHPYRHSCLCVYLSGPLWLVSRTSVTKYHKFDEWEQQKFVLSQFWVRSLKSRQSCSPSEGSGGGSFLAFLTSGSCWQAVVSLVLPTSLWPLTLLSVSWHSPCVCPSVCFHRLYMDSSHGSSMTSSSFNQLNLQRSYFQIRIDIFKFIMRLR